MKCYYCKGRMETGTVNFMTDIDNFIIIKNVPGLVCSQCGEALFNMETSIRLEEMVNSIRAMFKTEVAIVDYNKNVA